MFGDWEWNWVSVNGKSILYVLVAINKLDSFYFVCPCLSLFCQLISDNNFNELQFSFHSGFIAEFFNNEPFRLNVHVMTCAAKGTTKTKTGKMKKKISKYFCSNRFTSQSCEIFFFFHFFSSFWSASGLQYDVVKWNLFQKKNLSSITTINAETGVLASLIKEKKRVYGLTGCNETWFWLNFHFLWTFCFSFLRNLLCFAFSFQIHFI